MIGEESSTLASVAFVFSPRRILSHQQKKEEEKKNDLMGKTGMWVIVQEAGRGPSLHQRSKDTNNISRPASASPPPPPSVVLLQLTSAELLLCFVLFVSQLCASRLARCFTFKGPKSSGPKKNPTTLNLLEVSAEIMLPGKCQAHWCHPHPPPTPRLSLPEIPRSLFLPLIFFLLRGADNPDTIIQLHCETATVAAAARRKEVSHV